MSIMGAVVGASIGASAGASYEVGKFMNPGQALMLLGGYGAFSFFGNMNLLTGPTFLGTVAGAYAGYNRMIPVVSNYV